MADRRGSVMFDPARDHFVSTDDTQNDDHSPQEQIHTQKPEFPVDGEVVSQFPSTVMVYFNCWTQNLGFFAPLAIFRNIHMPLFPTWNF